MPLNRILFISQTGGFAGGVERFIYQAAGALAGAGVTVTGVFMQPGRNSELFAKRFAETGWGMAAVAAQARSADLVWIHKCGDLAGVQRACADARQVLYVHDHDYTCFRRHKYYPLGRINCSRPAGPFCRWCGSLSRGHGSWDDFLANLAAVRRFPLVLAGSDFMLRCLAENGVAPARLRRLEPLIDLIRRPDPKPFDPDATPRLLYIGRLIRGKGVDLALRAAAKLDRNRPWQLRIVGDGEDLNFCRGLAAKLGIGDRVEFTGYSAAPEEYCADALCAVFPSRWQEPFGMTGCEAMAQGLPVVGFDTGGVRQWLRDGENGLLVTPPGNVPALARALERVLTHPEEAARWGENGRKALAEITPERFAERALALFEEVFA